MNSMKLIGVLLFYALLIWLAVYLSINMVRVTKVVGTTIGVVGGVAICVALWVLVLDELSN